MYTFEEAFRAVMLLSCPAKKVTKERGIGEALSVALPRAKDALSYVPLPSRTNQLSVNLNGQNLLLGCGFTKVGHSTMSALLIYPATTLQATMKLFLPG